eukprot:11166485-Alexandrium_andersonii.AAC.1
MSAPASADWPALPRLARCLAPRPLAVYDFPWRGEGVGARTFADFNFAGRLRARRPTRGGIC